MLLDILTFLANLFLMRLLVNLFSEIFREASGGDRPAKFAVTLFYLGMLVLPSVAAALKRWPLHERMKARGEREAAGGWLPFGCVFIPFVYLAVNMWVTLGVTLSLMDAVPGSAFGETEGVALLLLGVVFNVFQTVLVFRYFSPPKHEPKSAFLRGPRAEFLGDVCVFVNMILFQVVLNYQAAVFPLFHEGRFVDRFIPLLVFALLMYLTGRIFFLVEDLRRPRTLLTILLANSVVIVRTLLLPAHAPGSPTP
ncbi:MAG TPA: hypothetical protein VFA21_17735 [Pyrinomonadaceae bacterium]|jgi:hypothetical protein|nr:hypothetical protein [Pyrinomonadaceae bacterium]